MADTPAAWEATRTRLRFRPNDPRERNFNTGRVPSLEEIETGKRFDWKPTVMMLLLGARDGLSPLSLLRGTEEDVIQNICGYLIYKYKEGAVRITPPAYSVSRVQHFSFEENKDDVEDAELEMVTRRNGDSPACNALIPTKYQVEPIGRLKKDRPHIAFTACRSVEFPEPSGININMMPFVMGDRKTLPRELQPYYDMIISMCPIAEEEKGEVMYLTVQESVVKKEETQRRPGLHIEAPSASARHQSGDFVAGLEHRWGMGMAFSPDERKGGLYIASNMNNTTAVWDALVDTKLGAVDFHGGIDHLRPYIGKGKKLPAGLLVWLTDHTPHEALPQEKDGYRQFFRLVTGDISVWFAAHSTPNPKVPVPSYVKIIGDSKFKSLNGSAASNYTDNDFENDSPTFHHLNDGDAS